MRGRLRRVDEGDEFVDTATQHGPLAPGDGQESRAVRLGEVVDVAAVVDQGTGRTDSIEELADEGEPPGAWPDRVRRYSAQDPISRARSATPRWRLIFTHIFGFFESAGILGRRRPTEPIR